MIAGRNGALEKAAVRLLRTVLPVGIASSIVGDLQEDAARLVARGQLRQPGRWVVAHACRLWLRFAWRRFALGGFGGDAAARTSREKGDGTLKNMLRDLRFGARWLARNPGFTVVAIVTLAIGIGANTSIFSIVNAVLIEPLPYEDPGELVLFFEGNQTKGWDRFAVSPVNFLDWREHARSFDGLSVLSSNRDTMEAGGGAEVIKGGLVSPGFFELLGARPILGRTFHRSEEMAGNENVLVLSHATWKERFAGDPDVVGRSIRLNGQPFEIVGVMPPRVDLPTGVDLWRPFSWDMNDLPSRGARFVVALGRRSDGVSLEAARREMALLGERLARDYPEANEGWAPVVADLREDTVGDVRPGLLILLSAVGLVLLIACANVANLLLARGAARSRELSIRNALGAGPARLMRQLFTESLVLAILGGAAGALVAVLGVRLLPGLLPGDLPRHENIAVDGTVLVYVIFLSLGAALLFGLVPAWRAGRTAPAEILKGGGAGSISGGGHLRSALVVAELAVSLVLLVGAALLGRSFLELVRTDPGLRTDQVLTMRLQLPAAGYSDDADRRAFFDELVRRIQGLPGVQAAGTVNILPLSGSNWSHGVQREGADAESARSQPSTTYYNVSPGYFEALGIRLQSGRLLEPADSADAPRVVVINQEFARIFFPGEDPLGRRVQVMNGIDELRTIVGVVADVRHSGPREPPEPQLYEAFSQNPFRSVYLTVRADLPPESMTAVVRREISALDRALAPYSVATMDQVRSDAVARPRFAAALLGLFAFMALTLCVVGLYGVISYTVSEQSREFGVRLALGAQRLRIFRDVVSRGLRLAALGTILGLGGALALTRLLKGLLFGVGATDPLTLLVMSATLVLTSVLAAWLPAYRATRVDPIEALRCE